MDQFVLSKIALTTMFAIMVIFFAVEILRTYIDSLKDYDLEVKVVEQDDLDIVRTRCPFDPDSPYNYCGNCLEYVGLPPHPTECPNCEHPLQ